MVNDYTVFSFFSGAGFLDLGFEAAGFNVAYVSEISSSFMWAYQYSRKLLKWQKPEYGYHKDEQGDINSILRGNTDIPLSELVRDARRRAQLIGFIGGPPCPDFSIGGKNKGRDGDNGKLSEFYIELICQQKPDFFIFENVKGLWRTRKHRLFFEELKQKLYQAGYITTEKLINAIEFGVPQDRERIILIGFLHSLFSEQKEIKLNNLLNWDNHIIYPSSKVFSCSWPKTEPFQPESLLPCYERVFKELTVEHWFQRNNVYEHPNAIHFFKPKAGLYKFNSIDEGDDSKKSFKRLHRWRYSPTACYGNNEVHLHPYKARRLSVSEALAIQSLPKDFTFPSDLSLTHMFKAIGNGVPYLASKGIAHAVSSCLDSIRGSHQYSINENSENSPGQQLEICFN